MRMRIPLLDLKAQHAPIRGSIAAAIERVVESQQFILGPEVEAFEREVAEYCGAKYAVGVSSGTDAILVSLMALGVGPGDEVITSSFTFVATAGCIARLGAKPVFVDIDPATFCLDAEQLERRITSRTKAIVPVHLFGQMADMKAIMTIASRRGIAVIEDAAQAIGAQRDGLGAGSTGRLGCLSFFPSKNLGAFGDAGMVLTNDEDLAALLQVLRVQGQAPRYVAKELGGNFRLDALQAAVLRAKLPHLDAWTKARQRNASVYRRLFEALGRERETVTPLSVPIVGPAEVLGARHVYHQFVIRARHRDALRAFLNDQGVGCEIYYPKPLHLHECFASWGYREGEFPEAERASREVLALPIYPELTEGMQETVVSVIAGFYGTGS